MIFIGLQGCGKSSFYERRFASTHLRISLDLAGTRAREARLLERTITLKRDFVIDNTNPARESRSRYILQARAAGYKIIGYFFPPDVQACLKRNAARQGAAQVPPAGIYRTAKQTEVPVYSEGFDQLFQVELSDQNEFVVRPLEAG